MSIISHKLKPLDFYCAWKSIQSVVGRCTDPGSSHIRPIESTAEYPQDPVGHLGLQVSVDIC